MKLQPKFDMFPRKFSGSMTENAQMIFPDPDTRKIKRTDNGLFTIEALSEIDKDKSICRNCARDKCPIRRKMDRVNGGGVAVATIRACGEFIPMLGFSVLSGLDLPLWNTFRLGEAWDKRLTAGMWVAIGNTKTGKIVRKMRVIGTVTAPLPELCDQHAAMNHAILSRDDLTSEQEVVELMRILRNSYGTNYVGGGRPGTAIYLEV